MIAFISVIRDDTDIMLYNWIYYYNLGIRNYYIMLHMPEPESYSIVNDFKKRYPDVKISITENMIDKHYHDKDCKILTDKARADGFNFIVGSDADELLILRKHKTIQDFLADNPQEGNYSFQFKFGTYPPLGDVPENENAFTFMTLREPEWRKQEKAIGLFDDKMFYVPGLHYIAHSPLWVNVDPDVAFYAHFPDRTKKQFIKKYLIQNKNWLERYGQFPLSEQIKNDPDFLEKHWRATLEKNYSSNLIYDPIDKEMFE